MNGSTRYLKSIVVDLNKDKNQYSLTAYTTKDADNTENLQLTTITNNEKPEGINTITWNNTHGIGKIDLEFNNFCTILLHR